jgi:uncharacterized protein YecE (DUF72 family)
VAEVRIGISGFRYRDWRGRFYPRGLPQRRELEFASQRLGSIEINGSFYALQRPELFCRFRDATPPGFVFAVKGARFITHMKKLRDVDTALANFFASGVLCLEEKLGPILWQFPEVVGVEAPFAAFFEKLPRTTTEASRLARKHDARLSGRAATETHGRREIRHAVEIRSRSCQSAAFVELLRAHGIALVVADTAGKFPYLEDVTAEFVYVRLHGDAEIYRSGYSPRAIAKWAERVRAWNAGMDAPGAKLCAPPLPRRREGRDVYVYFDNDVKSHAPFDAMALAHAVSEMPRRARA